VPVASSVGMNNSDFPVPTDRAFVVHFARTEPPGAGLWGRAEHITTGRATRFQDGAELMAFVAAVLEAVQNDEPPVA